MHLVPIRDDEVPRTLVVVRAGVSTLSDVALHQACERAYEQLGIHGFSVLEVPGGDYRVLARLRPVIVTRRRIMIASGEDLVDAGFALLPTMDHPHWTVVVSKPSARSSSAYASSSPTRFRIPPTALRITSMGVMTVADLIYDPNDVGSDLVVVCLVSQSPRSDDPSFDPQPGDVVGVTDIDGEDARARVVRRDGNLVWVQLDLRGVVAGSRSVSI